MSILALTPDWAQQAMLNEAEPPPPLHNETFERLEARVPGEFFHFLSNMSSFSGEFTAFANAMVRSGYCNSSKKLMEPLCLLGLGLAERRLAVGSREATAVAGLTVKLSF